MSKAAMEAEKIDGGDPLEYVLANKVQIYLTRTSMRPNY